MTLNYLQHLLEPDRAGRQPPFFVQVEGPWLALRCDKHLVVDAWELTGRLDEAAAAERAGRPLSALVAYRGALGLWRGEPFVDAPHATWAETARTRLRTRYSNALVRAGELELGESNHSTLGCGRLPAGVRRRSRHHPQRPSCAINDGPVTATRRIPQQGDLNP